MIMSINTCKKTIKLISLMRDTYVDIPDHGYNKLTVAFSLHGFDLLRSTIEKNFRLKIDQYVAVNFDAFTTIVDVMKGIDVKLTAAEAKNLGVGTTDGDYHLDGKTALVYSRIRSITGINGNRDDFGRNERQRTVMKALLTDAKSMSLITLKNVLETMLPEISTNMNKSEFLGYILHSAAYLKYEVSEYHLPMQGEYDDPYVKKIGQVLTLTDAKKTVLDLQHAIYG
jgi:LCP family protein required for cell wall assembly